MGVTTLFKLETSSCAIASSPKGKRNWLTCCVEDQAPSSAALATNFRYSLRRFLIEISISNIDGFPILSAPPQLQKSSAVQRAQFWKMPASPACPAVAARRKHCARRVPESIAKGSSVRSPWTSYIEPSYMEPSCTEPSCTEPSCTEPSCKVAQSQVAQSQVAQSQVAQSQVAQSQVAQSQFAQSQVT